MAVYELPETPYVRFLQTIARDARSTCESFVWATDRVNRLLVEFTLSKIPYESRVVRTPTDTEFEGASPAKEIQGVAVVRAGESMEVSLRQVLPGTRIGKILIQRDRNTLQPQFIYEKLPDNISSSVVFLMEPMLATGGSLNLAIDRLVRAGVSEENIFSLNYLASPGGIENVTYHYPNCNLVIASREKALTDNGFMIPGIGDFGDRYFGA